MNVALAFNVKPESETFLQLLSPNQQNRSDSVKVKADTYAEWDTWETINALKEALETEHKVSLVEADQNAFERFKELNPEIVFNVTEGFNGLSREAQIPAMLEMLQIPYSGSDALTLATCLDKARTKEILSYHKIPNPVFFAANSIKEVQSINLKFPLIVKPVCEGSSKGIFSSSFVKTKEELIKEVERITTEYNQSALIEVFLPGKEFTVAIIGNGEETEVLPIVEINYSDFPKDFIPIYSYEAKWILDTPENPLEVFTCPARIDKNTENRIKKIALTAYKTLKCRDWSRIDVRLDNEGTPNIIEINPLPGILPNPEENSCFPKAARAAGFSYKEMVNKVLYAAAKRYNLI